MQERLLLKQSVILECEQERLHRLLLSSAGQGATGEGSGSRSLIFFAIRNKRLADALSDRASSSAVWSRREGDLPLRAYSGDEAYDAACRRVHVQLSAAWQRNLHVFHERRPSLEALILSLRMCIHRLWPYSTLEPFGSYATDTPSPSSDIDLVVSFTDDFQTLIGLRGTLPLLQVLADYLAREASHILTIKQVFLPSFPMTRPVRPNPNPNLTLLNLSNLPLAPLLLIQVLLHARIPIIKV